MLLKVLICCLLFVYRTLAATTTMPVGNLPGWRQIFTDDFTTNVALGSFPGPYAKKWKSYTGFGDTSDVGWYDQAKVLSVSNGILDMYMHTDPTTGKPLGAAPCPLVSQNGTWGGQLYGRFSVRFRADALLNYGTGWLLWPDSENWNEGEIDFPEGNLAGSIHGYVHCIGNPSSNCLAIDTKAPYTSWHIATIEWTPSSVKFLLDDVVVGTSTNAVPKTKFHWVLQACTTGVKPAASLSGHIQIDWAVIYAYDPSTVICATGALTDQFSSINTNVWTVADAQSWGQSYFKASQVKAASGLTLNMTKSGCPTGCGGLAMQSGKISSLKSWENGTVQINLQTSAVANFWIGWQASNPRDGYEIRISGSNVLVQYYKNAAYNYIGSYTLGFNPSAAVNKFTISRTSSQFNLYANGVSVAAATGTNLPLSSGPLSFTLQSDNAITTQSTTSRITSFSYLPAGCPFTS